MKHTLVFLIFELLVVCFRTTSTKSFIGCDREWARHGKKCYRMYEHPVTFSEAIDACSQEYIGQLASVTSKEEQYFIRDHFFKSGGITSQSVWIGGVRASHYGNNDVFYWIGGKKINFTAWEEEEPDNLDNIEYCVAMLGTGKDPELWFDTRCDYKYWALCQRDVSEESDDIASDQLTYILSGDSDALNIQLRKIWSIIDNKNNYVLIFLLFSIVIVGLVIVLYRNGDFYNAKSYFLSKYSSVFARFEVK